MALSWTRHRHVLASGENQAPTDSRSRCRWSAGWLRRSGCSPDIGSITKAKIRQNPAPSIRAAFTSSSGQSGIEITEQHRHDRQSEHDMHRDDAGQ